ncbi:MAG: CotH kinase family protein [Planctomycetes bacterium]|nr:CotH kinase family protein [Planctomycetota bacterium]
MAGLPPKQRKKRGKQSSGFRLPVLPIAIGAGCILLAFGLHYVLSRATSATSAEATSETPPNFASNSSPTGSQTASPISTAPNSTGNSNAGAPGSNSPSAADERSDNGGVATPAALSASDEFFTKGLIPELRITIEPAELETLRKGPATFVIGDPRPYVHASIVENGGKKYENVALKLKGSAGSYRPVDDRPALTINVDKYQKDQTFHGLSKFHLNNSVQDDTYINEWLAEELFREAGVPATRVTHARVWLNDRDLGFYVLKSSFDKSFLKRHFGHSKGSLYEGGFVQDIDVDLQKEVGENKDDRADLKDLLGACREQDVSARWKRLEQLLDIERFISFMAMEMMIGHWDGYTLNHNNYRLFFDARTGQANFLPHGTDQLFGDPNASVINLPSSIMGSTVMQNGTWRARYRERVGELLALFSPADGILQRVDTIHARIRPVLNAMGPQVAQAHDDRVRQLKARLVARAEGLIAQQSQEDPRPRSFDDAGRLALSDWNPVTESPDAKLEVVDMKKVPKAYSIRFTAKGRCNASWRCKTLLGKGTYLLHAKMKTERVAAVEEKGQPFGAGIRISGMTRDNVRRGTANWMPVDFEFTIEEDTRMVEFILELRAKHGQVWFDSESLFLTRVQAE